MPETFDRGLPSLMTNWTPSLSEVAQPTSEGTLNAAHDTFQMLQGDATTSPKDIARTQIFHDYLDYCRGARNFVGIDEYLEPDFSSIPEPVMSSVATYGVDVDLSEVPEEKRFVIKPVDDLDDYDEDDEYESPDFDTLSDDAKDDVEVISLSLDDWEDSSDDDWEDLEDSSSSSSEIGVTREGTFDYPDDSEDEWEDSSDDFDSEEDEWDESIDEWEDSTDDPDSTEDEWEDSTDDSDSEEDEWEDSSDDSEDSDGWEDSTNDSEDSDGWEDSWEADSTSSPTPSVPQHSVQTLFPTPAPKPALTKERRAAGSFERIFDRLTQKGTR